MGRPRTINPDGDVSQISFRLPAALADDIRAEARDTGRSVGAVVRDRLDEPVRRSRLVAGLLTSMSWPYLSETASVVRLDIVTNDVPEGFPPDARIVVTAEGAT